MNTKLPSLIVAALVSASCLAFDSPKGDLARVNAIRQNVRSTGKLIKIAVVDTGLDQNDPRFSDVLCETGHKNFAQASANTYDTHGHGTHIAGLIKQYAGNHGYCLIIIKYFDENSSGKKNLENSIMALYWAVRAGADIVNFSGGGPAHSNLEKSIIQNASNVVFVMAAGNEAEDISKKNKFYPASYELPNIVVVGNISPSGFRSPSSNYGDRRIVWEVGEEMVSTVPCKNAFYVKYNCEGRMTGTSQSTAVHTGKLVRKVINGL